MKKLFDRAHSSLRLKRTTELGKGVLQTTLDLVYPRCCVCCDQPSEEGFFCACCPGDNLRIRHPRCEQCSLPVETQGQRRWRCPNCGDEQYAFESVTAAWRYAGGVRRLVHDLKYRKQRWPVRPLGCLLKVALEDERLVDQKFDWIVPVPIHFLRRLKRGFNQAELLALEVNRLTKVPMLKALRRFKQTPSQTQLSRAERKANLANSLAVRSHAKIRLAGACCLLVDDVLTTCSTMHACATLLRDGGARQVIGLVVARS
ncbi:MAG: ComF family protein [Verrucomicrobiales bacterium]